MADARTQKRKLGNSPRPEMAPPKSNGRNQGRYCGEKIDVDALLRSVITEAARFGWEHEIYYSNRDRALSVLHRVPETVRTRVYISAGIHGDEPAGPTLMLELLKQDEWPDDAEIWLFPCLNPTGFRLNTRENAEGIDLNRDYLHKRAAETRAHVDLLEQLPRFDLILCLHEDWEALGFYLYELNPAQRDTPAEALVQQVSQHCPIDRSEMIDGRPASSGIIRPDIDPETRSEWPEPFYLILNKTSWSFTLEAPSDFDLVVRVNALAAAVNCLLAKV